MKICFTTTKDYWISKCVKFFTDYHCKIRPNPSHTFPIIYEFVCKNGQPEQIGLSADEFMVNMINVKKYKDDNHAIRIYELPDRKDICIDDFVAKYNKKNYGWFDLLWFIWRWGVFKVTKKVLMGPNPIDMGTFCSELSYVFLVYGGYEKYLEGYHSNSLDATDMENIIANIPGVKLVYQQD